MSVTRRASQPGDGVWTAPRQLGVVAFLPKLARLLGRAAPHTLVGAAAVGVVTGLTSAAAIATIHRALRRGAAPSAAELVLFVALCLSIPVTRVLAHRLILKPSMAAMMAFVLDLTARILATPLRRLEEIGSHRVLSALTEDMTALNLSVTSVPTLLTNGTLVVACAAYLAWLDPLAALLFLVVTATAIGATLRVLNRSGDSQRRARAQVDVLFSHFRDHLDGIKELQLNARSRRELRDDLQVTSLAYADAQMAASSTLATAMGVFQLIFILPVGLFIFAAAWWSPEASAKVGEYAIVLLYAMGPVNAMGSLAQNLSRGAAALGNIESLHLAFGDHLQPLRGEAPAATSAGAWRQIVVRGAVHRFRSEDEQSVFTLGPLDLVFDRGDVVFLAGGNGSGKTTFAKILCGLYLPEEGYVGLGDQALGPGRLEAHRQEFAAVFSDFHLFRRLLGIDPAAAPEAGRYLEDLGLAQKVRVIDGRFTTTDVSQGQRKRLALVASLLEDRNVYIFDEWASDQDRTFRAYFYDVILTALRERGKTVFVVSHDERYFHVADRVVKFELGQVVADTRQLRQCRPSMSTAV